jgi:hypothetical protein
MTRKHFEKIAKILSESNLSDAQKGELGLELAKAFQEDNPRFSIDRFMKAVLNEG